MVEALERIKPAVRIAVAIGPVVVAGCEDGRRFETVEVAERRRIERVIARAARAGLEVAVMDRESQPLRIHIPNEVREAEARLLRRVRQVAPKTDCIRVFFVIIARAAMIVGFRGTHCRRRHGCDGKRPQAQLVHHTFLWSVEGYWVGVVAERNPATAVSAKSLNTASTPNGKNWRYSASGSPL